MPLKKVKEEPVDLTVRDVEAEVKEQNGNVENGNVENENDETVIVF